MNDLDRFFQLLLQALDQVDQSYYSTVYQNIGAIRDALAGRGRFRGNNFERFGERVFCYELYHQLRILVDTEKEENPDFLHEAVIQGEVRKMQIFELVEMLGLTRLSGEFIPDFLIHTPGNADYHPYVIEVKSGPDVNRTSIMTDLAKLNQFVTRYNYQRGVFLAINSLPEYITEVLNQLQPQIQELAGRGQIRVVCKQEQHADPAIWELNEL